MPQTLQYDGRTDAWTPSEFKDLVDVLEAFHDPANDNYVRKLFWNVRENQVFITLQLEATANTDIDTAISTVETALSGAPKTWPTGDEQYSWG